MIQNIVVFFYHTSMIFFMDINSIQRMSGIYLKFLHLYTNNQLLYYH